jgi:hypothetical protein
LVAFRPPLLPDLHAGLPKALYDYCPIPNHGGTMEEQEPPLEGVQEDMHERAHHAQGRESWIGWAALSSALIAALAAIASLLAGYHSEEAMVQQTEALDTWNVYQAKSIKSLILERDVKRIESEGKEVSEKDRAKLAEYDKDKESLQEKAKEQHNDSVAHAARRKTLSSAVTMFQIAIAMAAISVLTKRKPFLFVSLAFGAVGICFLVSEAMQAKLG